MFDKLFLFRWLEIRLDFCGNAIIFFAALLAVLQRDNLDAGKIGLSLTYALVVSHFKIIVFIF